MTSSRLAATMWILWILRWQCSKERMVRVVLPLSDIRDYLSWQKVKKFAPGSVTISGLWRNHVRLYTTLHYTNHLKTGWRRALRFAQLFPPIRGCRYWISGIVGLRTAQLFPPSKGCRHWFSGCIGGVLPLVCSHPSGIFIASCVVSEAVSFRNLDSFLWR